MEINKQIIADMYDYTLPILIEQYINSYRPEIHGDLVEFLQSKFRKQALKLRYEDK